MSDPVLDALVSWGEATAEVRAMILTSGRAVLEAACLGEAVAEKRGLPGSQPT